LILEKLNELNPTDEKGARKKRLHQFLNEDFGTRVLRDRISKITAVLQISPSSRRFIDNFMRFESKQPKFEFIDDELTE
jgi:hypothetical protein